ncbi:aminopeptidase [Schizosaccharomyces octosporus yFS286]|uniref:Aminopeptidase n=1 Tax=Schizosaccharomyces octosporus (strain yFS286) TaxID=483514 RepID=S9PZR9_SCHOY|nr:aminopeptidase [Schizosaccharomyces octosporus yFS286]EPX74541.1 aminopeptidase [Schizosaccharomyces octosporus yFS286]
MVVHTTDRLSKLRALMKEREYSFYVVPSEDAHASEYTSESDARRAFISGFDGSAGCAVIGLDSAALFTDGRYFNQASQQLDENCTLMKQGFPGVPSWQTYCSQKTRVAEKVGIDSSLITFPDAKKLREMLYVQKGSYLCGDHDNLVDQVWGESRPKPPCEKLFIQELKYAGMDVSEKLKILREAMKKEDLEAFVVSMLDEVAWLYNLRGADVPYNPVFYAYSFITHDKAYFYVDEAKLTPEVVAHVSKYAEIRPYSRIFKDANECYLSHVGVSTKTSWCIATSFGEATVYPIVSPIAHAKGIKNDVELKGMKDCHVRDGSALVEYFAWLEEFLQSGGKINEYDAATKLESFRRKNDNFVNLSFETISSTGSNGAVIHYSPPATGSAVIDPSKIYLCDSGAQYKDGTTDVTRTWHFREPTEFERQSATLVLKGHIAIINLVFPKGTTGFQIDALARQHLWQWGLDYLHGTGHGVGSFLNVHELPIGIGSRDVFNTVALEPGMVTSNEPGFYEDGHFGFRVENCVYVTKANTKYQFAAREYYGLKDLTMAPHCKKLIDPTLLCKEEVEYINKYHARVYDTLSPLLSSSAKKWLAKETSPL